MRRLKALESFDKSLPESRWKGFLTSCAPFCKPAEALLQSLRHSLSAMAIISFTEFSAAFASKAG